MSDPHRDWPRISGSVFYTDARRAIDWLCDAFAFETRIVVEGEGGRIEHSELVYQGGVVMVATADAGRPDRGWARSPGSLGGANTQALCVYVDDVDAHCARARAAGATIFREPTTDDHGEGHGAHRTYGAVDPEGHHWWFMHVARDPTTA
jgi:uncharacterized glyoxalase superfamily protein PhnB